ncbi:MAG: universal stress protein [Burkholderiaceae bacterium]
MKILVPVDGSKYSRTAVDFVASRSTLVGTNPDVEVLNVQLAIPTRATRVVGKDVVSSYYTDEAEKALRPARTRLQKAGMTPTVRFAVGNPADEISAAAAKDDVDLLVMGSHGHSALRGLLVGSVTNAVLAQTKTPILIVRHRENPPADSLKVGIAVDGSKFGREAVKYVLRHRELFGANPQITLLHVVADFAGALMPDMAGIALPAYSEEDIRAMQKKAFESAIRPVRKLFQKAGVQATEVCLAGSAGEEIAAYAKKKKLDVLVMGSHGYGAFKAAVMGSVATRVAHTSEVPLLLVRHA